MKIWYKDAEPSVIISFGKSVGVEGESFFDADFPVETDHEFYNIDQGPPKTLVKKPQNEIDAILAARQAAGIKARLKRELEQSASSDVTLFRMIMAVNDMAVSKGLWANNEFPQNIKDVAMEWKQKLNEIDS